MLVSQTTALRVKSKITTRPSRKRSSAPRCAVQYSCRWRERRAVKRNRNRGSHHFEQNPYPSGLVQPVERPHETDKRAGQDPNVLPFDEIAIQSCQAVFGPLDQRFDDTNGDGHRATVPTVPAAE